MARIDAGALRFRGIGAAGCTHARIDVVATVPRYRLETIMIEAIVFLIAELFTPKPPAAGPQQRVWRRLTAGIEVSLVEHVL